jgi:hypothetical protein
MSTLSSSVEKTGPSSVRALKSFVSKTDPRIAMVVYETEDGRLFNACTLAEWMPTDDWYFEASIPQSANVPKAQPTIQIREERRKQGNGG